MSPIIAALIAQLIAVLGPMLIEWLKSLFVKAERNLGEGASAAAILDESIRLTRGKPFRRAILRTIRASKAAEGGSLTAADKAELAAYVSKARKE
jgi:hypothetical protein